jgi:hypothetical protein
MQYEGRSEVALQKSKITLVNKKQAILAILDFELFCISVLANN